MTTKNLATLQAAKAALGPLTFLDFSHYSLVAGPRALGAAVAGPARHTLARRLDGMQPSRQESLLRQARACRSLLEQRSQAGDLPPVLRTALLDPSSGYLACLDAWAEGMDLQHFTHPKQLAGLDGRPVTASDLAMLMQHDNTGCQTGLYRLPDGALIFWHAEEDVHAGRLDGLPVARLACPGLAGQAHTCWQIFTYPDLMPGPAFAWREDGYVQSVDLLYMNNPPSFEQAVLANVVAWLALRLGSALPPAQIAAALQPFYDAYALNTAWRGPDRVHGGTLEFGAHYILPRDLNQEPGSRLFQVNRFCRRDDPALLAAEKLRPRSERSLGRRYQRTLDWLERHPLPEPAGIVPQAAGRLPQVAGRLPQVAGRLPQVALAHFLRLLGCRQGGAWAYANSDVRAYFLAHLAPPGAPGPAMQIWLGPGPVLPGEQPQVVLV